jgi:NAD(P)H-hydrate epimerase
MSKSHLEKYLPQFITSEDMAVIDENATSLDIPAHMLMEKAGAEVAKITDERFHVRGKRVLVFTGIGNNGGDGFVAARYLFERGASVYIVFLGEVSRIRTPEARMNYDRLLKLMGNVRIGIYGICANLAELREEADSADVIVDAILGTGIVGPLNEPVAESIKVINQSGKPVIAVDTPTGLDPSTGKSAVPTVRANVTVTFHKMKKGLVDKKKFTGEVVLRDIGIPVEAELFTGPGDVRRVTKPRSLYSYKANYGYVLIIGGNNVYSGAPALAAMAALRTGAGLAILAVPSAVVSAVRAYSPDIIAHALPGEFVSSEHLPYVRELLEKVNSLVIGPGIGLASETKDAVNGVLKTAKEMGMPTVIDADALKAIQSVLDILKGGNFLLTPHAGEFQIISGVKVADRWEERADVCLEFAKRYECTLLLKGHETVITDGFKLKVNRTGNPGMATGGTGDVLSGIIGAYLAQGCEAFHAASAGAYVNGAAGDLAYNEKGYHLVASDLIEKIPLILKNFDRGQKV